MIIVKTRFQILCFLLLLSPVGQAAGQELFISNRTFDTDVSNWIVDVDSSGTIEWSGSQGQPPGSLKFVGENQIALPLDCFNFEPGFVVFSADAYMEINGSRLVGCELNYALDYESYDCSGRPEPLAIVDDGTSLIPYVDAPFEWQRISFTLEVPDNPEEEIGAYSYRPILVKDRDAGGDDFCYFDNVSLTFIPRVNVPAVSPAGLGALALVLALAAGVLLRRRA